MRARRFLLALVTLGSLGVLGAICQPPAVVKILSPTGDVTTQSFTIAFQLTGAFTGTPEAFLNFQPLVVSQTGPSDYTASISGAATQGPGFPMQDDNLLLVKAVRTSDGMTVTAGQPFAYDIEKARAYEITSAGQCPVSGPLAHRRLGDYCLENDDARFVVQDVTAPAVPTDPTPRDFYSVGAFGGNIIDAVLPSNPTTDNFLELQAMLNIETVANYQTLTVVNDGQDGTAAIVRVCGPDDLLDFVNPSSAILDAGLAVPPGIDDNDQDITACTTYTLEPGDAHVRLDTEVFNNEAANLPLFVGEWMNTAGEVDGFFKPNDGVGEAVTGASRGGLGWFAERQIQGADRFEYGYVSPANASGYVTISGVTIITHAISPVVALLGVPSAFVVPAAGSNTYTRYMSVGDGSGNQAQELADQIFGRPTGTVQGCVTVGGAAAPNATVTVGTLAAGAIDAVLAHFITDASGCYSGQVEVPAAAGTNYGVSAARERVNYVGGTATPPVTTIELFPAGDLEVVDFALPDNGTVTVTVTDETGSAVPARITVVGLDPSPEPFVTATLPGFGSVDLGLFNDLNDDEPFGVVAFDYTGADGVVTFELETGTFHVFASRGTEYSLWGTTLPSESGAVTVTPGSVTNLTAQIARVVDTPGFVSSDVHVHGVATADSQVSDLNRVESFSGEGVDNLIATDHHVHKDYGPAIVAEGLSSFLASTVGEEITTFDYGHFNSYPVTIDASVPSGGSTDWAVAAPPGEDFPSYGNYNLAPSEIFTLATTNAQSTPATTVQINHIGSHFSPLKIDTSLVPPADAMTLADRASRRLHPTVPANLFFAYPALELWNGNDRGHQSEFLDERIGIWMNLLDQDIKTTAISDTDTHDFRNLRTAGARSWTAASAGMDTPSTLDPDEVAASVDAGRVVGGQGVYVQSRLLATDGSGGVADLTRTGSTTVTSTNTDVNFEVSVSSPAWAQWDTIEIYSNAGGNVSSVVVDPLNPYAYTATPITTRSEGDCDPTTTGDGDFDITVTDVFPAVDGAERWEATVTVPFTGLTADTWFVAVVKGTDGACGPMFPVYPDDLNAAANTTLADFVDGNVGEQGTMALGVTNALYYQH
ncbi:MAG: hypothetical protein ACQGVC_16565 [Myxococcota bacterium]